MKIQHLLGFIFVLNWFAYAGDPKATNGRIYHFYDRGLTRSYLITFGADSFACRIPGFCSQSIGAQILPENKRLTVRSNPDSSNERISGISGNSGSRLRYLQYLNYAPVVAAFFNERSGRVHPSHAFELIIQNTESGPSFPPEQRLVPMADSTESREGILYIIPSPQLEADEFYLHVTEAALRDLNGAEQLLASQFIHHFLKFNLIRSHYTWQLEASPPELICDEHYPAAFPDVRLEVDRALMRQILFHWPRIHPLMDNMLNLKLIAQLKSELRRKLELRAFSDPARLTLSIKMLARTGYYLSTEQLVDQIVHLDDAGFFVKMQRIIDQRLIDKFWFTTSIPDNEYLDQIDAKVIYELIRN